MTISTHQLNTHRWDTPLEAYIEAARMLPVGSQVKIWEARRYSSIFAHKHDCPNWLESGFFIVRRRVVNGPNILLECKECGARSNNVACSSLEFPNDNHSLIYNLVAL